MVAPGTSARSISIPMDSVLCILAIVSEGIGLAAVVLIAGAEDVRGASVTAGEDVI